MGICTACTTAKPIARCLTNLIVGTITPVNTSVYVFILDITTGREIRYTVTSSAAGLVTVPITPQRFSEDHSYELRITKADADNIDVRENITISGDVADCVNIEFKTVWNNNNTIATFANQTLTV